VDRAIERGWPTFGCGECRAYAPGGEHERLDAVQLMACGEHTFSSESPFGEDLAIGFGDPDLAVEELIVCTEKLDGR
jgi:hypothetical protein